MELDLTTMADEIAASIWDARALQHMQGPYAELSIDTQNKLKESILPVMFHAIPIVERVVKEKFQKDVEVLDSVADLLADLNLGDPDDRNFLAMHLNTVVAGTGRKVRHG